MSFGRSTSRRAFVKAAALAGGAAIVAACGGPAATPVPPTPAPAGAAPAKPPEATKPAAAAEPTKPAAAAAPTTAPAAAAAPAAAGKKQKLSISHIGGGSQAGSDASVRMKELRTAFPDVDIENRWVSYAAYVDKISVMTATGDLADLQFCNAFNDVPLMMDNNLLLDTGPLLEKQGKHIMAATPKEAWDSTTYEGKQYAVAHSTYDLNNWGIYYRKDYLDKVGLKVPETLDEYTEVLRAFTFKDPDGNGKPDTFGRAVLTSVKFDDDVFHAFDVAVGHHANGFWRDRGGKLELDWVNPGMKDAWAWWRARWAEKVIDPDSLTAQITYRTGAYNVGRVGTMYNAWTGMDPLILVMKQTHPNADLVAGPALKGPKGQSGFTGEGFPWVFVMPKKTQVAELGVRMINWFFEPPQVAKFVCDGEPGLTNKGYNDKGWCVEYTPAEKKAMGAEWTDRNNKAQDIQVYSGVWTPILGNSLRPWLLNTLPADMKTHFEGVLKARYSPGALQGMDYAVKGVKTSQKKRPTKSEQKFWPGLQSRFLETMTQVVAGTQGLEEGWKDWLGFFEKNGGPTLTQEVNDIK
jgi:ABC-type glycerol-3-phosphate transport system substrate-binding protein